MTSLQDPAVEDAAVGPWRQTFAVQRPALIKLDVNAQVANRDAVVTFAEVWNDQLSCTC